MSIGQIESGAHGLDVVRGSAGDHTRLGTDVSLYNSGLVELDRQLEARKEIEPLLEAILRDQLPAAHNVYMRAIAEYNAGCERFVEAEGLTHKYPEDHQAGIDRYNASLPLPLEADSIEAVAEKVSAWLLDVPERVECIRRALQEGQTFKLVLPVNYPALETKHGVVNQDNARAMKLAMTSGKIRQVMPPDMVITHDSLYRPHELSGDDVRPGSSSIFLVEEMPQEAQHEIEIAGFGTFMAGREEGRPYERALSFAAAVAYFDSLPNISDNPNVAEMLFPDIHVEQALSESLNFIDWGNSSRDYVPHVVDNNGYVLRATFDLDNGIILTPDTSKIAAFQTVGNNVVIPATYLPMKSFRTMIV